jgi:PAS domain S-box-containing protein
MNTTKKPIKNAVLGWIAKDGHEVLMEYTIIPVTDEKGNIIYFETIGRDITERKKAEIALRESKEKLRNIFESANDCIFYVDKSGRIIDVNRKAVQLFGRSRKELFGRHFAKVGGVHLKDMPTVMKAFAQSLASKHHTLTVRIKDKTGQGIPLECSSSLVKADGKVTGILVIAREITERKKAEEMIIQRNRIDKLRVEIWEAAAKISEEGELVQELLNKVGPFFGIDNASLMRLYPKKKKAICDIQWVREGGKGGIGTEIPLWIFKRYFGKPYIIASVKNIPRLVRPVIIPFFKRFGTTSSLLVPYGDIDNPEGYIVASAFTEEKEWREEEIDVFCEISRIVSLKAEQVKTREALKETLEKLRVVGGLTRHDVRNKLSAVTGNVYLAKQKLTGDSEVQKHLEEIESAIEQTVRIFDFARSYERLGVEALAYMDVAKSIKGSVSMFSDLHGVKVVNDCRGLKVLADSLLRRLFYNLIDNSLKYGEKITQIRVYYEEAGKDKLRLVYEDNGVGIPKAEKEKIFRDGYGRGTGYGLYFIRKMCEAYGWTIEETGKHGEGAQFTITISKTNSSKKTLYKLQK